MSARSFVRMLKAQWVLRKFVCVGLDPDPSKIPGYTEQAGTMAVRGFLEEIILSTHDLVGAYKPNLAFFEQFGPEGLQLLVEICQHIRSVCPQVPIILDAKRGDIGNTNEGYARFLFDRCCGDAVTVHPYLGQEALAPFLARKDKGVFVLCRTSNPGAGEFQDFLGPDGTPLYLRVARNVATSWNANNNCGLVTGATYPIEIAAVREVAPNLPLLIPGVGKQGGDLESAVKAALAADGEGNFLVNASRDILYASKGDDYARAARAATLRLHGEIIRHLGLTD